MPPVGLNVKRCALVRDELVNCVPPYDILNRGDGLPEDAATDTALVVEAILGHHVNGKAGPILKTKALEDATAVLDYLRSEGNPETPDASTVPPQITTILKLSHASTVRYLADMREREVLSDQLIQFNEVSVRYRDVLSFRQKLLDEKQLRSNQADAILLLIDPSRVTGNKAATNDAIRDVCGLINSKIVDRVAKPSSQKPVKFPQIYAVGEAFLRQLCGYRQPDKRKRPTFKEIVIRYQDFYRVKNGRAISNKKASDYVYRRICYALDELL